MSDRLRRPTDAETASELTRVEREPLLPAEKRLIAASLTLGVVLLVVLYVVTSQFLPPGR